MNGFRRFAVYYTPEGDLARFGAGWLGWDSAAGAPAPHPDLPGLAAARIAALTAVPRRYGFHATLKPPFALAGEAGALADDLRRLAAGLAPVVLKHGLRLAAPEGFLALIPVRQTDALTDLAARLVAGLDHHRAPLTPEDRARRRPDRLTPHQRDLLDRWGYPWVMDQFRFHMTLTGPDVPEGVAGALAPVLVPLLPRPFVIDSVTLSGEDDQGRFHDVMRVPLGGQ